MIFYKFNLTKHSVIGFFQGIPYNFLLFLLLLCFLPKVLWQTLFYGKYKKNFFVRFKKSKRGFDASLKEKKIRIWLHAPSVGEVKGLSTLIPHIKENYPEAFLIISTLSKTGQKQAKSLIPSADAFCYLPFDFSWIIGSFVKTFRPHLLVLVEGDFWLNFMSEVKKWGGKVVLVSGKISEKSFKRYLFFPLFRDLLFKKIDRLYVQGKLYQDRFLKLGIPPEKIFILGNLKYDIPSPEISHKEQEKWKKLLGIDEKHLIVTVGSTHEKEEELLLTIFQSLWKNFPQVKVLLAPRHPERFKTVEKILQEKGIAYGLSTQVEKHQKHQKVILINQIGILPYCYKLAHLTIVGGSFVKGIGGHDIFEPAKMGVPVLFGPFMHTQIHLVKDLLEAGVGKQLHMNELQDYMQKSFLFPSLLKEEGKKGVALADKMKGVSSRTWQEIQKFLPQRKSQTL